MPFLDILPFAIAIFGHFAKAKWLQNGGFGERSSDQPARSTRMLRKLAQVFDVTLAKIHNSFHSHEYGKN